MIVFWEIGSITDNLPFKLSILSNTGVIQSNHLKKGKPERLINGMDYLGNICGVTNYETGNGKDTIDLARAYFLPSGSAICIESCPKETDLDKFYCKYDIENMINEKTKELEIVSGSRAANETKHNLFLYYTAVKDCMPQISTRDYLGYCKPSVILDRISDELNKQLSTKEVNTPTNVTFANNQETDSFFDETMADAYLSR